MILNEEQMKVVNSKDPFIFLLAGAGSGKTRVIVERIRKLLKEGVKPQDILAITFTRKASHEMKERLHEDGLAIHTFHQLAYITLKEDLRMTFDLIDERILDHYTQDQLLQVTMYKNSLYQTRTPKIYLAYQEELRQHQQVDYDDLLILFNKALQKGQVSFSYRYIFIDEFQDTNLLQYACLKKLIKHNTHVLAVGDPDQSIYQFRGASSRIINQYVKDYHARVEKLTYNYRSYQSIITAANRLIKRNNRSYKKELKPTHQKEGNVFSLRFRDDENEALWLISQIKLANQKGIKFDQIAILYRNHHRAYQLMMTLHDGEIPFTIHDDETTDQDGISLLTIHQAKGLEFDLVFIIGCEDHLLPSRRINQISALEEERRLMFVAMTRAKHILCLTHISHDGQNHHFTSSPFILESGIKSSNPQRISDIISLGDENGHQKTHR